MRTNSKHSLRISLSQREFRQLLLLLLLLAIVLLFGLYLGWWSLQKEEKEEKNSTGPSAYHVQCDPVTHSNTVHTQIA